MMESMQRSVEKELEDCRAFVIDDAALENLHTILAKHNVTIGALRVAASDGSEITFASGSVLDARQVTNSKVRAVTRLRIFDKPEAPAFALQLTDPSSRAQTSDLNVNSIKYSLRGSDAHVLELSRDLDEWLVQCRPSYALPAEFVAKLAPAGFSVILGVVAFLVTMLIFARARSLAVSTQLVIAAAAALATVLGLGLLRFTLPLAVFTFGTHGAKREGFRAGTRATVWGAIALGFVVNLIASIAYGGFPPFWLNIATAYENANKTPPGEEMVVFRKKDLVVVDSPAPIPVVDCPPGFIPTSAPSTPSDGGP